MNIQISGTNKSSDTRKAEQFFKERGIRFQVLAIQKKSFPTPEQNMDEVRRMLDGYTGDKPDFILLPEIFTCPYDNSCFPVFAQKDGGDVFCFLQELARSR